MAAWVPTQLGRHEVDRRVADVERASAAPRTVLLSDSISYEALNGIDIPEGSLDLSSNQTIGVAGNYFLVKRLLENNPGEVRGLERIVYALSPSSLSINLDNLKWLETYFLTVFLRPEESRSIAQVLGRNDLTDAMDAARWRSRWEVPSSRRAGLVRDPLGTFLRAQKSKLQGAAPAPTSLSSRAKKKIDDHCRETTFERSQVTDSYLPLLADLCLEEGIELILITAPVAPSILSAWESNGYWEQYLAYTQDFASTHGAVRWIVPCPLSFESDLLFYDGSHLEQASKGRWGRALAEWL